MPDPKKFLRKLLVGLIALIWASRVLLAVTLEWDPSPDAWVAGYAIHYGEASRNWTVRVDVGNRTSCTISNLTPGTTYYFVATAYAADGQESLPSNEVAYTVPGGDPPTTNAPPVSTNQIRGPPPGLKLP